MDAIGVRDLRQNASRHLARVERGERLKVTDRGRAVALLVPIDSDPWEALIAQGRVTPPTDSSSPADELPIELNFDASGRLAEMREAER